VRIAQFHMELHIVQSVVAIATFVVVVVVVVVFGTVDHARVVKMWRSYSTSVVLII
jgi:hypothetical protein